jgi:hypothetical protein
VSSVVVTLLGECLAQSERRNIRQIGKELAELCVVNRRWPNGAGCT